MRQQNEEHRCSTVVGQVIKNKKKQTLSWVGVCGALTGISHHCWDRFRFHIIDFDLCLRAENEKG